MDSLASWIHSGAGSGNAVASSFLSWIGGKYCTFIICQKYDVVWSLFGFASALGMAESV